MRHERRIYSRSYPVRIKFFCAKCNEWSDEWLNVSAMPTPEEARQVHNDEIHQCWILVDYETTEGERLSLTL